MLFFISCNGDEYINREKINGEPIKELIINYKDLEFGRTMKGKSQYDNVFDISCSNMTEKDIIVHAEITVKEYGTFESIKNMGTLFTILFQTYKIIYEPYIS